MTIVSLGELQAELPRYVNKVHDEHDEVFVTDGGERKAVLVDAEQYLSTQATMDLLGSPSLLDQVDRGLEDPRVFSMDDLLAAMDTGQVPPGYDAEPEPPALPQQPDHLEIESLQAATLLADQLAVGDFTMQTSAFTRLRAMVRPEPVYPLQVLRESLGLPLRQQSVELERIRSLLDRTRDSQRHTRAAYDSVYHSLEATTRAMSVVQAANHLTAAQVEMLIEKTRPAAAMAAANLAAVSYYCDASYSDALRLLDEARRPARQRSTLSRLLHELIDFMHVRRPELAVEVLALDLEQRMAVYKMITDGLAGLVTGEGFVEPTILTPPMVEPVIDEKRKLVVVRHAA